MKINIINIGNPPLQILTRLINNLNKLNSYFAINFMNDSA